MDKFVNLKGNLTRLFFILIRCITEKMSSLWLAESRPTFRLYLICIAVQINERVRIFLTHV